MTSGLRIPTFVAIESGLPVGMMAVQPKRPTTMAHRAELTGVYVRRENRA